MKSLFLILSLLPFVSRAQTDTINNFIVENREVVWRKVFHTELPAKEVFRQLRDNGIFIKPDIDSLKMFGEMREFDADHKGAGYSYMLTPIYLSSNHINAFSTVEYKDGKYRVVVKKIILLQSHDERLTKMGDKTNIEFYAAKGNVLKPMFKKDASKILDHTFTKLFTINEDQKSDW